MQEAGAGRVATVAVHCCPRVTIGRGSVSLTGVVASAGGAIVVLFALLEALAQLAGGSFLSSVILGADKRTSTSKTFVFLWTMLVGWALIALLIAGQLLTTRG